MEDNIGNNATWSLCKLICSFSDGLVNICKVLFLLH